MFGNKNKSGKEEQDSLDDLLGDLLDSDETPKKKPAQGRSRPAGKTGVKNDSYASLSAMAEKDVESDISDADVGKMAKAIARLDDMDADLFGSSLKKKDSFKGNKGSGIPRSNSTTPRSAAERVASPTRSDTPTSPPSSARGNLKRKPVKPSSSSSVPSAGTQPPGTAPGKLTDLSRASENLKPGKHNKNEQRPSTVPRAKKLSFGDFDEDDPLAGLSLDEDSVTDSEARKKTEVKKRIVNEEKSVEEEPKLAQPAIPSSPRKSSLIDRPPTRSGSGNTSTDTATDAPASPKLERSSHKHKDELIFSDDNNFLHGLGIDANEKSKSAPAVVAAQEVTKTRSSAKDDDDDSRPAKSVLDSLLGRGQKTASSLLETKEKPRTFVLDKKYTQAAEEKKEDDDDFLFGSYQPSVAGSTGGSSRPGSRRSVRFQDDDDIFGLEKPLGQRGSTGVADDMKWLEELTVQEDGASAADILISGNTALTSPVKTPTGAKASSPVKSAPDFASADKMADTMDLADGMPAKENLHESSVRNIRREATPETKLGVALPSKKADAGDWLGVKASDSDEELFIPKRRLSRSPGIADITPQTPPSVRPSRSPRKTASATKDLTTKKSDDDEEEDSFIARAKARRQAALGNKTRETTPESRTTNSATIPPQLESPRFEGSVPVALHEGQAARDLFAFPPSRNTSMPKFETPSQKIPAIGLPALLGNELDSRHRQSIEMTTGIGKENLNQAFQSNLLEQQYLISKTTGLAIENPDQLFQPGLLGQNNLRSVSGSRYDAFSTPRAPETEIQEQQLHLQQQLQLQQQGIEQQEIASTEPHPSSLLFGAGETSEVNGKLSKKAEVALGPIPSSLQDAFAQLRKLEIEKQNSDSLLESTKKRYEEEIIAIEKSYRNRLNILEESNQKSEARLRAESERLMEEHLAKVKRMEQEKADMAAENFRRMEDQERTFAQETEKLREKHRQAILQLKKDHEEAQQQLLEAKNKEILKVASSHDTSRNLTAAVEQIESNARDLGQLQLKLDEWQRSGLDEREIALRGKDEQLKILQARLTKQEEDNEKERHRLEDLIARMESQNRDQLRQLEEERWKLKQEQSRIEAQKAAIENERRMWSEQQARERQSLDKARDIFFEEQHSGLSHLTNERCNLAEERSKLNMEQKLHRDRMQQDAIRTAQAQAEYDILTKTVNEEKMRAAERMRDLRREEERILAERDRFHERTAALEQEKERLEKLALGVRQKSTELQVMSEEASHARITGERALTEARLLHSQLEQRQAELEAQQSSLKATEDHIAQEKLRLAKEKKDVENLKQAGMCINCRNMLQGAVNHVIQKSAGSLLVGTPLAFNLSAGHLTQSGQQGVVGMTVSSLTYEHVASSIANDRAVRMWKIQAIKDQEYLEEESMFLEGLKHSPYHSNSKV